MKRPVSPRASAVALFGATVALARVDAYSESNAAMLARKRSLDKREFLEIVVDVAPVMVDAQAPTIVFFLSVVGLIEHDAALRLAETVAFVFLF